MIERQNVNLIVNGGLFVIRGTQVVAYRNDASVEEFDTAEEAEAEHQQRYPEQYEFE